MLWTNSKHTLDRQRNGTDILVLSLLDPEINSSAVRASNTHKNKQANKLRGLENS